jgi:hypothetical protein
MRIRDPGWKKVGSRIRNTDLNVAPLIAGGGGEVGPLGRRQDVAAQVSLQDEVRRLIHLFYTTRKTYPLRTTPILLF